MEIEITKDIEDIRENRSKLLRKGTILVVTNELGKAWLKTKCAKETKPKVKVIKAITNEKELEEHFEDK
tara:strand:+ start:70 stop:276 length:207 start_codon:yes stop_codon:yes gene_type:complete